MEIDVNIWRKWKNHKRRRKGFCYEI